MSNIGLKRVPTSSLSGGACRLTAGLATALVLALLATSAGCEGPSASSPAAVQAFKNAGPVRLKMDMEQLVTNRLTEGPYKLVRGDVLALQMPAIMRTLPNRSADETEPYKCRIDSAGKVVLPIAGEAQVAGKTLSDVESLVAGLYWPKYFRTKPGIVATVADYKLASVSVMGAVEDPGIHELKSNECTLISAVMKAGGIAEDGATSIKIIRKQGGQTSSIKIPVVAMNIPARDARLADGDTVMVEARTPEVITVVGLVKKPGLLPCKPNSRHNVMDALAFAGGIDEIADPKYVTVYRQGANGGVISAVFDLKDSSTVSADDMALKPGDIVAVEQTPGTRTRMLLAMIVRVGFGANAGAAVGP